MNTPHLDALSNKKYGEQKILSNAELAILTLYNIYRYTDTDAAKESVRVAEAAAGELSRKDAALEAAREFIAHVIPPVKFDDEFRLYVAAQSALQAAKGGEE